MSHDGRNNLSGERIRPARGGSAFLLAAGTCLATLCIAGGCTKQSAPHRYEAFAGTVERYDPETGEFALTLSAADATSRGQQTRLCVITKDSEVYVNDKLVTLEALQVGDSIEVIGYQEHTPQSERFTVTSAYVTRDVPPPSPPDLSIPTTSPTTQAGEP